MKAAFGLRVRLTAWYCLVNLGTFVLFGALTYAVVHHQLLHHHDGSLRVAAESVESILQEGEDCVHLHDDQVARLDAIPHLVLVHEIAGERHAFYRSPGSVTDARALPEHVRPVPVGRFETVSASTGVMRVFTAPYHSRAGRSGLIRIMEPLGDVEEPLHTFRIALALMAPLALLVAAAGGYWLAGRALAPVDRVTRMARDIEAHDLGHRLPEPAVHDEIGRLVDTFNQMIGRLDGSFQGMKRFTADAAHELRSPLANLRGIADVTLGRLREPETYREAIVSVREEVDRLQSIVEDLLVLARADAGRLPLENEAVRLDDLCREVVEAFEDRARTAGISVDDSDLAPVVVMGDERWLRQAVSNLVDNAVKFTAVAAENRKELAIATAREGSEAVLVVRDTGPGLREADIDRVFERFYRADPARGRGSTEGFGLGLSIAASIIRAHGGTIAARNRESGGCAFSIRLESDG